VKSSYRYILPEVQTLLSSKDLFVKAKGEPTRLTYGEALLALGSQNPNVVSLDADVSKPMKTFLFPRNTRSAPSTSGLPSRT